MNEYIEVRAIVEGRTEQLFVERVLAPYMLNKHIYMTATQATKPGMNGGDIKYTRLRNDIIKHLNQRQDIYVTTIVDYYGVKEWPGLDEITRNMSIAQIEEHICKSTRKALENDFPKIVSSIKDRFIPFMMIHEFEALYFSNPEVVSDELGLQPELIQEIINQFSSPEEINNSRETAPSKRLTSLCMKSKSALSFRKTTQGIAIAEKIGIDCMRRKCPEFDKWIKRIESISSRQNYLD